MRITLLSQLSCKLMASMWLCLSSYAFRMLARMDTTSCVTTQLLVHALLSHKDNHHMNNAVLASKGCRSSSVSCMKNCWPVRFMKVATKGLATDCSSLWMLCPATGTSPVHPMNGTCTHLQLAVVIHML